jgi:hypothetical protein
MFCLAGTSQNGYQYDGDKTLNISTIAQLYSVTSLSNLGHWKHGGRGNLCDKEGKTLHGASVSHSLTSQATQCIMIKATGLKRVSCNVHF